MLDKGSGGPTRYFAHGVVWNARRRIAARRTVVAVRDISELASLDHGPGSPDSLINWGRSNRVRERIQVI